MSRATEDERWGVNGFLTRGKEEGLQALSSCRVFFPSTALQNVFFKDAFAARNKVLRWFLTWLVYSLLNQETQVLISESQVSC